MIGSTTPQDVGVCSYFEETGTVFRSPANPLYLYLHQNGIYHLLRHIKGTATVAATEQYLNSKYPVTSWKVGKLSELDFVMLLAVREMIFIKIFISIAIFFRPASLMPSRANPTSRIDFPGNGKLFKFELYFNRRYTSIDHRHLDLFKPHPS